MRRRDNRCVNCPSTCPAGGENGFRLHVDLILAGSTPHARAAQQATRTIPIVVPVMGDPVADGLVASLARPGAGGLVTVANGDAAQLDKDSLPMFAFAFTSEPTVPVFTHPLRTECSEADRDVLLVPQRALRIDKAFPGELDGGVHLRPECRWAPPPRLFGNGFRLLRPVMHHLPVLGPLLPY